MNYAPGWTWHGAVMAFAVIASASCTHDGPLATDREGPSFTYGTGPATVSAVGGNGVTLSMTVNTTRIILDGGPGTDVGITFNVSPYIVFPGTPQAHVAEIVFDSVWYRRDYDGFSARENGCGGSQGYVKNGMVV